MSILLSSLRAQEILLANASSNVANMNTPGYKAIRTTITSSADGAVDVATNRSDDPAPLNSDGGMESNVDLAKEFSDMILSKTGFESVLNAIKTRDDMLNDLMNTLTKK
jgi:flagellar basal-body rod protein FlgC